MAKFSDARWPFAFLADSKLGTQVGGQAVDRLHLRFVGDRSEVTFPALSGLTLSGLTLSGPKMVGAAKSASFIRDRRPISLLDRKSVV